MYFLSIVPAFRAHHPLSICSSGPPLLIISYHLIFPPDLSCLVTLGSLGLSSIVKNTLWVALEVVEGVSALLLGSLGVGRGADFGVCWGVGLLVALALWLWGLTTLVWGGHFWVVLVVLWFIAWSLSGGIERSRNKRIGLLCGLLCEVGSIWSCEDYL